jgi:hypothetical protein
MIRWMMNSDYELSDDRWIVRLDERWIVRRNELWTWIMNEQMNDRTNERSEFWQYNGWTKIIWTNERTNDRMIGRMNKWTMNDRMDDRTIGGTNELWTFGRTIEWTTERSLCACCACVRVGVSQWVGLSSHEMAWDGMSGPLAPLLMGKVGD